MAILQVYKNTDLVLRVKCKEVENINVKILQLVNDMWETMESMNAIGLAANQVGEDYRIICIKGPEFSGIMINPEIVEWSDEIFHFVEGCLSMSGLGVDTGKRSRAIKVKYTAIDGKLQELWTKDLTSVIIQHEVDHLDGILMTDYLDKILED